MSIFDAKSKSLVEGQLELTPLEKEISEKLAKSPFLEELDRFLEEKAAAEPWLVTCQGYDDSLRRTVRVHEDLLAIDWIETVIDEYPRGAVGQLDHPETVTHYIGEIGWEGYDTRIENSSLEGTVGIVVLGRPGAEGDDLSCDLLADLEDPELAAFVPNRETEGYVEGQHQLELTREELSLLAGAKAAWQMKQARLSPASTTRWDELASAKA